MNFVFFGSPQFAAIILTKLIDADMVPSALVCNPDRPVGRKKVVTPPQTKQIIQGLESPIKLRHGAGPEKLRHGAGRNDRLGIEVFQPETKDELVNLRKKIFKDADIGVVAAYSQIIPVDVIEEPGFGIIGVHPSLLPRHRGASPIQSAILNGDSETGTTLFLIDNEVDHGPILVNKELRIRNEGYEELMRKLAELSGDLLIKTMPRFIRGEINPYAQDESSATYTNKFVSEDGYIDSKDLDEAKGGNKDKAVEIYRKIRALNPEPGVYTILNEKRIKLLRGELRDGKLVLTRIQREGKKPVEL